MRIGSLVERGVAVVAATRRDLATAADYSNRGELAATSWRGGARTTSGWMRWAGTSFSTPIVGAVAARLWATKDVAQV